MGTSYLLDNAGRQTGERFYGLEATFDPVSRRHLDATGVAPGWSCWEIGAGGGSIARWLAERVGPEGSVLATDLNLEWAVAAPNVELRQHDVVRDPIPERAYDLIHARLVLVHLAERAEVIDRLIAALKPGGWLVLEEFDDIVRPCPDERTDDERVFNKVRRAFLDLLRARGADLTYPRRLPHLLRAKGLRAIAAEGHVAFVTGGSAGAPSSARTSCRSATRSSRPGSSPATRWRASSPCSTTPPSTTCLAVGLCARPAAGLAGCAVCERAFASRTRHHTTPRGLHRFLAVVRSGRVRHVIMRSHRAHSDGVARALSGAGSCAAASAAARG